MDRDVARDIVNERMHAPFTVSMNNPANCLSTAPISLLPPALCFPTTSTQLLAPSLRILSHATDPWSIWHVLFSPRSAMIALALLAMTASRIRVLHHACEGTNEKLGGGKELRVGRPLP